MDAKTTYTVIDRNELTLIIAEACLNIIRPEDTPTVVLLAAIGRGDPETLKGFQRAADAALMYIAEATGAQVQKIEMSPTKQ